MNNQKLIQKVVSELKKEKSVKAIYLFGSQAKGKTKPYSDIDFCVLTKHSVSNNAKEEILSNSSEKIDISLFWDLPLTLQYRVLKEGKLLLNRDELLLHRATNSIVLSYLDFKPHLNRHIESVLGG